MKTMAASAKLMLNSLTQLVRSLHTKPASLSSFRSSRELQPLEQYPEVEIVHNPPEWKFVERLLPPATVPQPIAKPAYPSGWQPPKSEAGLASGYFVARTKNHMVPVYLHTRYRGQRRLTVVRRVHGDIWALERQLRALLERARNGKLCATRVNELSGQIHIHGDYVDLLRTHLKQLGF